MAKYILCPRCELNYINEETQEYCDVCIKEMQGAKTFTDDLEEQEAAMETEICPICGENYMRYGEKMCEECKKKTQYEEDDIEDPDKDDAWRSYLDDDSEDIELGIPESEFAGELEEEEEEEEEEIETVDEDDFEYVSADDYIPDEDDDDDDDDDLFDDDEAPTPRSGSGRRRRDDDDDF